MSSASGFDFSPLLHIMLMGLAVALGPLFWLWLRSRTLSPAQRLRALTLLALFVTFDLVLFGAFTRLTDSGLGCPDWPGCYGHASPMGAQTAITLAQEAMPTGPVTHGKAWIEMLHRYMATGVGVLIVTLLAARWWEGRRSLALKNAIPHNLPSLWWPALTLLLVCLQGAFGALTVTMKLFPAIVTLHLLGALLLLAVLAAQASRYDQGVQAPPENQVSQVTQVNPVKTRLSRSLYAAIALVGLLLTLQITLGGWVSTNYAVLACQDFPVCQGRWWPVMDFQQGFTVWRELGLTGDGTPINFTALTAIHYTHRLMAYLVLTAMVALAWRLYRVPSLQRPARTLALLAVFQLLTGLSNVVLGWPLVAALAHTGGAAAMVMALVWAATANATAPLCPPSLAKASPARHPIAQGLTA